MGNQYLLIGMFDTMTSRSMLQRTRKTSDLFDFFAVLGFMCLRNKRCWPTRRQMTCVDVQWDDAASSIYMDSGMRPFVAYLNICGFE